MIIIPTILDRKSLADSLRSLIKDNKCEISNASKSAINAGFQTFSEPFPVNKALIQRAIETIQNLAFWEKQDHMNYGHEAQRVYEEDIAMLEIDSIGPDLLRSSCDDLPF